MWRSRDSLLQRQSVLMFWREQGVFPIPVLLRARASQPLPPSRDAPWGDQAPFASGRWARGLFFPPPLQSLDCSVGANSRDAAPASGERGRCCQLGNSRPGRQRALSLLQLPPRERLATGSMGMRGCSHSHLAKRLRCLGETVHGYQPRASRHQEVFPCWEDISPAALLVQHMGLVRGSTCHG